LEHSAEHYGLGLTIGNAEARLLELANAYACLARLGEYRPYRLSLGAQRTAQVNLPRKVADPAACYLIADILSDNEARTPAFGAESALRFKFPVACKTGTSSDFRDNWAFGYTPEFTVGVWVGNFDGSPMMHVSGVSGAAPVMHDVFEELHRRFGTTWYSQPTNLMECVVHPITGHRLRDQPGGSGANGLTEKFMPGAALADETAKDYTAHGRPILGPEYAEWFASGDNWLADRAVVSPPADSLRILFPLPGTVVYLNPDRSDCGRNLPLEADGSETIEWRSQSLSIGKHGNRQIALLAEGRHELAVRDRVSGQEARTWIEVIAR
jgi:penicillin-binding protein 1C